MALIPKILCRFAEHWMILHLLSMRRNVNRNVFNYRENVSATTVSTERRVWSSQQTKHRLVAQPHYQYHYQHSPAESGNHPIQLKRYYRTHTLFSAFRSRLFYFRVAVRPAESPRSCEINIKLYNPILSGPLSLVISGRHR